MVQFFQKGAKIELTRLRTYTNRLGVVISELLAKANELDQDRSFAQICDRELSQTISQTCEQLITLADSISLVEHLLKDGQLEEGRRNILITCDAANAINKRLETLRQRIKSKFSHNKFDLDI